MDQKPIVPYPRIKGMALDAIHNDLARTLGKDAVAYSTVTKYARSAQFSGRKEATPPEAPDVERNPVDDTILTALAEFPLSMPGLVSLTSVSQRGHISCHPVALRVGTDTCLELAAHAHAGGIDPQEGVV
jgi:hypothetical protein